MVGIIIHGEAVTEVIKSDLLRVTQAEVNDLEVRAVRLETENRAAIAGIVLLAFLGGEIEAAVADRAPDTSVRTNREAVHVVAGERDAHAEAVFNDLTGGFDAVLLGVLHHPEFGDTREIDRVIPGHHSGASAIQHVIEAAGKDLVGREGAVGLLAADMADELGLGRHPLVGTLGLPLLMQSQAIGGGRRGEVVVVPVEVVAVILDAEAEAVRFGYVHGAVVSKADGGGRGDAGDLAVGRDLKGSARDKRGTAFAGDAHEAGVSLGLGAAALREGGLGFAREDEMVRRDEPPGADMVVDDPDDTALALKLRDVPDSLA